MRQLIYSYREVAFHQQEALIVLLPYNVIHLIMGLALMEVWESVTPKNCPETSKNQCQEVLDSNLPHGLE